MKKLIFLSCLLLMGVAKADIRTDMVVLRSMDKITGRVQKIDVRVGETTQVGTLSVLVQKCLKKPPEETPENAAFLVITDKDEEEKSVFQGWMFSSNPALSAMEHPVYDIWVVECRSANQKKQAKQVVSQEFDLAEPENDEPIED